MPDSLSCRHENYSGLVWTETAQNWNKSVTQSNRPFTAAVGRRGFRARENLLLLVFFVISFSISKSCIFFRRLFQWVKAIKLIMQNCKFRKALEQVEIQRNALCKSKVAIFALLVPILTPEYYLRFSGFQSSLLLIHFRYGSNTCSHCHKEWYRNLSDRWRFTVKIDSKSSCVHCGLRPITLAKICFFPIVITFANVPFLLLSTVLPEFWATTN